MTAAEPIDRRELRDTLGVFTTGVTVITIRTEDGTLHGVTANSFSSVSLDPPLVLWSQALSASRFPAFRDCNHFTVNILAHDQIDVSNHFTRAGEDAFRNIDYEPGLYGAPLIKGAAAQLECRRVDMLAGGDHAVFLGQVERISNHGRSPLVFGGGKYQVARAHELGSQSIGLGASTPVDARAVDLVRARMPDIAKRVGDHTLCLATWGNYGPTVIHWEPSAHPVSDQLRLGLVLYVTQSATGLVFASLMPREATSSLIAEELRLSRTAGEDAAGQQANLDALLAETREHGLACGSNQAPSPMHGVPVTVFSAPILGKEGQIAMALSLMTPRSRLDQDRNGDAPRALKQAALELSAEIARL